MTPNWLIQKYYEKRLLKIYFIDISFLKELFYKKTLYFLLFLLEFDLFIDFPSPDVIHTQSGSTLDFCMIFVNYDWTILYDFLIHSTLRESVLHMHPFSCVKRAYSIEI